jgi:hypothetical protein
MENYPLLNLSWTMLWFSLLGALAYLIVRGEGMAERAAEDYRRREQAFQE